MMYIIKTIIEVKNIHMSTVNRCYISMIFSWTLNQPMACLSSGALDGNRVKSC